MTLQILELPSRDLADIPKTLRNLAEAIERNEYDEAHNLVWVMDCGDGRVEVGLAGQSSSPATLAHFLMALGQKKLTEAVL